MDKYSAAYLFIQDATQESRRCSYSCFERKFGVNNRKYLFEFFNHTVLVRRAAASAESVLVFLSYFFIPVCKLRRFFFKFLSLISVILILVHI